MKPFQRIPLAAASILASASGGCRASTAVVDTGDAAAVPSPATTTAGAAVALPGAERRTRWRPGVPAGIPQRSTICARLDAASYGGGTRDATTGIQAAIDGCPEGHVVLLGPGTFVVNRDILYIRKGITLRGSGPDSTTLSRTNGADVNPLRVGADSTYTQAPVVVIGPNRWPSFGVSVDLATDAIKGGSTVGVVATTGLAVGDIVLLDELEDPTLVVWNKADLPGGYGWFMRHRRPIQEWKEITRISGTTVTFGTPFHTSYRTGFAAQLTPMAPGSKHVKYAGVEDLKVRGGSEGNVRLVAAAYSWVKRIEATYWSGDCVSILQSFRCELRDSFIHDGDWPFPGGAGYGISLSNGTSDTLIENNICVTTAAQPKGTRNMTGVNKVIVSRAAGAGSVVGYNYLDNGIIGYNLGWQEVGLNGSHMVGSHHMLFEGNHAFNADGDKTHGNQTFHTFFRNHLTGTRSLYPDIQNRRCVGLAAGNWWMSFIGNVLGMPGPAWRKGFLKNGQPNYENSGLPWDEDGVGAVWRLGYDDANWAGQRDPKVLETLLRHGNFDYLTGTVVWEPRATDRTLPASMYLGAKPRFFRGLPWPWVDPTGPIPVQTLPAKARYDAGTPFAETDD